MFCKLNGTVHDSFAREYQALRMILDSDGSDSIRVPRLRETVQVAEGVAGVLIDLIDTKYRDLSFMLSVEGPPSESLRLKWESQLVETLARLHAIDVVCGDAKTANVLGRQEFGSLGCRLRRWSDSGLGLQRACGHQGGRFTGA